MYGGYTLPKSTNQRVYTVQSSLKHGHYGVIDAGEGIDPYGVLAMIAFSVFLFYIIYSYLNQTGNGGKRGFSDEPHQQIQAIHHINAKQGRRADKLTSAFDEVHSNKNAFQSIKPKDLFATDQSAIVEAAGKAEKRPKTSKNKNGNYYDDDDVIPIIPDLEEVQEEDLVARVAEAPTVNVNRVADYNELDSDLLKHAAFATLDEIDLRALTRSMAPESALKESDEEWTWDTLFANVGGELQEECVSEDVEEEEGKTLLERPFTAFNKFPV
ncbi:IFT43 [Lepeophtheirus salmonis]|uniref:IFT43 n=1 Tax=Lepeophtheirus salmonis TaxID=72036 RepID=A0A7R8HDQ2_LEPSM|nr:IFT43 [Lepeophtheirus salmonis]CAF3015466.1 IFT43 [Lepeophtheirus salmonis]